LTTILTLRSATSRTSKISNARSKIDGRVGAIEHADHSSTSRCRNSDVTLRLWHVDFGMAFRTVFWPYEGKRQGARDGGPEKVHFGTTRADAALGKR
jgi:hypothetical protein